MQNNPYEAPVAAGAGAGGALSTGAYEFNAAENEAIGAAGKRSKLWGIVALGTGVLGTIALTLALVFRAELASGGLPSNYITIFIVALFPIVAVNLVVGALYIASGNALGAVVTTQGDDVAHMMRALSKLGTAFLIEFLVGIVVLVTAFTAGVLLAVYEPEVAAELQGDVVDD